jgi:putative endonuclease
MELKKTIGNKGEQIAVNFLLEKGFSIIARNWRYKQFEVDIIAEENNLLHFVEVKTRTGIQFGYPEESISQRKMESLKKAAIAYLDQFPEVINIQFDAVSILIRPKMEIEITFIEDIFF